MESVCEWLHFGDRFRRCSVEDSQLRFRFGSSISFPEYVQVLREGSCYKGYQIETIPERTTLRENNEIEVIFHQLQVKQSQ